VGKSSSSEEHAFQRGEEFVERNLGQVTERPEIHAQDRNAAFTDRSRDGEQRAVAPEHDHQVDFVDDVAARLAGKARCFRGVRTQQHFDAAILQPFFGCDPAAIFRVRAPALQSGAGRI